MSGIIGKNSTRGSGAIGAGVIGADAISGANIADDAIDSEHYTDGSIDNAHIADDAIDSEHYADGSIDLAHLSADCVDATKIADDAIDSEHYTDGSIDNAHIADDAIDSEHYADGSIDNAHIADDAIDSEHYADGSIDNAHIADDAIDSEHYADGSIDTAHIATNQIDETLMKDAFVGDFTDATVTASDYFIHGDATDSGNTKKDTVQGILDLVSVSSNLDGLPDSDHSANGPQTNTFAAGYTTTQSDLVYLSSAARWEEADADATGVKSTSMLAIALEVKDDGEAMNVALPGSFIRDDSVYSFTPGVPLYMHTTDGGITATKPTGSGDTVRTVGYAVHANMIFFNPSSDYVTLV